MVRLKEFTEKLLYIYACISIPYGAIKRYTAKLEGLAKQNISIPYGAIKSLFKRVIEFFTTLFQFLMVRLKVTPHLY